MDHSPNEKEKRIAQESNVTEWLKSHKSVPLSSVTVDGYPRVCQMELLKCDTFKEVYFFSLTKGNKVNFYLQNNKAGISFYFNDNSISLTGDIEVISDNRVHDLLAASGKKEIYVDSDGTPLFSILKFSTKEAWFLIDGTRMYYRY